MTFSAACKPGHYLSVHCFSQHVNIFQTFPPLPSAALPRTHLPRDVTRPLQPYLAPELLIGLSFRVGQLSEELDPRQNRHLCHHLTSRAFTLCAWKKLQYHLKNIHQASGDPKTLRLHRSELTAWKTTEAAQRIHKLRTRETQPAGHASSLT
jgi:hypothetical protein